jgi:hypothetical protein
VSYVCVYFGHDDECQCCGGSASLGGTQEALRTDIGVYCSAECHDEIRDRFYNAPGQDVAS